MGLVEDVQGGGGGGGWGGEGRDAAIKEQTSDNGREERGGTCLTGSSLLHLRFGEITSHHFVTT